MVHTDPVPEPPGFDEKVRQPGNKWLQRNPNSARLPPHWALFRKYLANGFHYLCGYGAMYEPEGTVDHYVSWKTDPSGAYEWSNYRFASQWINSSKQQADKRVLDPYEVEDGWFEILLPSLQLVLTDRVPASVRDRAEYTLKRLHLRDDERAIRQRQVWYGMYQAGDLTLKGLEAMAPLIARAVRRQQAGS